MRWPAGFYAPFLLLLVLPFVGAFHGSKEARKEQTGTQVGSYSQTLCYLELANTLSGPYNVKMLDLEDGRVTPTGLILYKESSPKISPSGRFMTYLRGRPYTQKEMAICELDVGTTKVLTLNQQIIDTHGTDWAIQSFEYLDDTTYVFSVGDKIYTLASSRAKPELMASTNGRFINELSVNRKLQVIALMCSNGVDPFPFKEASLSFFDISRHEMVHTSRFVFTLGNWTPNGRTLLYQCNYANKDTTVALVDFPSLTEHRLARLGNAKTQGMTGIFLNNNELIFVGYPAKGFEPQDLYLFDLKTLKVAKRLTSDGRWKAIAGIFQH